MNKNNKINKITTIEMEVALMARLNILRNIIVPNVSWGLDLHECDLLILTPSNYATEIEIKVSKYDLLKDKNKWHEHQSEWISRLYFAVPYYLEDLAFEHVPERAGIYVVYKNDSGRLRVLRKRFAKPKPKSLRQKWDEKRRQKLLHLGCMRILTLKKQLVKKERIICNGK